jgi:hypothetical protein
MDDENLPQTEDLAHELLRDRNFWWRCGGSLQFGVR